MHELADQPGFAFQAPRFSAPELVEVAARLVRPTVRLPLLLPLLIVQTSVLTVTCFDTQCLIVRACQPTGLSAAGEGFVQLALDLSLGRETLNFAPLPCRGVVPPPGVYCDWGCVTLILCNIIAI